MKLSDLIYADGVIERFIYAGDVIRIEFRDYSKSLIQIEINNVIEIEAISMVLGFELAQGKLYHHENYNIFELRDDDDGKFAVKFATRETAKVTFL